MMIPESLKYLLKRRPENALERINEILTKLKKDTLHSLPEVAAETAPESESRGLIGNMAGLLTDEHRPKSLARELPVYPFFRPLLLP